MQKMKQEKETISLGKSNTTSIYKGSPVDFNAMDCSEAKLSLTDVEQVKKRSSKNYFIWLLVMLVILGITFYSIFKGVKLHEVLELLQGVKVSYLFLAFLMMLIYQHCIARQIQLLLGSLNGTPISYVLALKTSFIGFFFNNLTPAATGGQPMQIYYLHKKGINPSFASVSFVVMAVIFNGGMVILAFLLHLTHWNLVSESLGFMRWVLAFGYLFNTVFTAILYLLAFKENAAKRLIKMVWSLVRLVPGLKNKEQRRRQLATFITSYAQGSNLIRQKKKLLKPVFFYVAMQLLVLYSIPYFAAMALGAEKGTFDSIFTLQSVLYLAAASIPTPGAVGITEKGFVTMFSQILPTGQVVSAMLLTRIVNLYSIMMLSAIPVLFAVSKRKKKNQK